MWKTGSQVSRRQDQGGISWGEEYSMADTLPGVWTKQVTLSLTGCKQGSTLWFWLDVKTKRRCVSVTGKRLPANYCRAKGKMKTGLHAWGHCVKTVLCVSSCLIVLLRKSGQSTKFSSPTTKTSGNCLNFWYFILILILNSLRIKPEKKHKKSAQKVLIPPARSFRLA